MQRFFATLIALTGLFAASYGLDVTNPSSTATGASALTTDAGSAPTLETPSSLTTQNATVAGNNVLVTRNNIIVMSDQNQRGLVNLVKNLVLKGSSPQDDDTLATQIVAVLGAGNSTSSQLAGKMMPKIKAAFQSRDKPAQLRQIIVKLTEMSPKLGATEGVSNQDA
jgi:hypothetical protein